jgi:hypothetical protein
LAQHCCLLVSQQIWLRLPPSPPPRRQSFYLKFLLQIMSR